MPRLNIETSIFQDEHFNYFERLVGDKSKAMGALVYAWMAAQKRFQKGEREIPIGSFNVLDCAKELLESGLAIKRNGGIYMRGSEKEFNWLQERRESGRRGGAKSAKNRSSSAQAQLDPSSSKRKPLTLPLSHSLPLSQKETVRIQDDAGVNGRSASAVSENFELENFDNFRAMQQGWNALVAKIGVAKTRQITRETPERLRNAKNTLISIGGLDQWKKVLSEVESSDFLKGKNRYGWTPTFKWMTEKDNALQVLEGQYRNKGGASNSLTQEEFERIAGKTIKE